MDLLKHELYKIFSKKYLFVILIVLLSLFYIPNYLFASKDIKINRQVAKYSKPYEGEITKNNKEKLFALAQDYKDKDENMGKIYDIVYSNYTAQDRKRVVAISDTLKNNNESFYDEKLLNKTFQFEGYELEKLKQTLKEESQMGKENTYDYKNKKLASKMYSNLSTPKFSYIDGWDSKFNSSNALIYIIAIVILLGVSTSYSNEYKSKVHTIILSSKKGRNECVIAKILASIIYAIVVVCICQLVSSIFSIKVYGTSGFNAPMQCLFDYICSPYNFTVGKFWIISFLTSIIGAVIFALIILFISNITKSSLMTFFIGGCIFIIPNLIDSYLIGQFWWKKIIVNLSIPQFMNGGKIYSVFSTTNVFGKPVLYPYFSIFYAIIVIALFSYCLYISMKNMQVN